MALGWQRPERELHGMPPQVIGQSREATQRPNVSMTIGDGQLVVHAVGASQVCAAVHVESVGQSAPDRHWTQTCPVGSHTVRSGDVPQSPADLHSTQMLASQKGLVLGHGIPSEQLAGGAQACSGVQIPLVHVVPSRHSTQVPSRQKSAPPQAGVHRPPESATPVSATPPSPW